MASRPAMPPRFLLRSLFDAALEAARPRPEWFADLEPPQGRTVVVGAGKAAASMAAAFEEAWPHALEGLVVTRYGHGAPTARIEVVEAAHPVPDEAGVAAARRVLASVERLGEEDLVVALMSGGGSSLLTLPAPGVALAEKQALSRGLLGCGASIGEINAVRKALSAIKGGRLLAACGAARVVTYIVSDVPGDDPSVVASGPTVPDATPPGEALRVIQRYGLAVSASVRRVLDTPSPATSRRGEVRVVASAAISLEAAARQARAHGIEATILSDRIEGEAREAAEAHAEIVRRTTGPRVLLSGGETTVTVRGSGRGGRNVEFLAALARALDGDPHVTALAADTDGIDGAEPVAGAFVDPTTVARAGTRLHEALANNDAHALFELLGDRVVTGPTLTNVNDFRAILVE